MVCFWLVRVEACSSRIARRNSWLWELFGAGFENDACISLFYGTSYFSMKQDLSSPDFARFCNLEPPNASCLTQLSIYIHEGVEALSMLESDPPLFLYSPPL